jgi:uncharacterized membrane protein YozB (DUF420 family)
MALLDPNSKNTLNLIKIVSILIPVVVAILFGVKIPNVDTSFLPPIYATINGCTAVLLIGALVAIKTKHMRLHKALIRFRLMEANMEWFITLYLFRILFLVLPLYRLFCTRICGLGKEIL